ncbi:class I SAM-dependent methyltransferase [Desulfobulbus propionicus]|nr:class I SAM-dependent methyltransferase [Desulfobulbus propionicus]
MTSEKRDFDKEAALWDEKPQRVKLATEVAEAMVQRVALTPTMEALDFGCGTGLLTLQLQPLVRSITGVDSSAGMLAVLEDKINRLQLANVRTLLCDLDQGERLTGRYDLVVSSMTLHHIREVDTLLRQWHDVLAPGGTLAVADLDSEGGRFHGDDNTGVFHFGFDRAALSLSAAQTGFNELSVETATEIIKPDASGRPSRFTVFLLTARKG